jgi:hypothetical protein
LEIHVNDSSRQAARDTRVRVSQPAVSSVGTQTALANDESVSDDYELLSEEPSGSIGMTKPRRWTVVIAWFVFVWAVMNLTDFNLALVFVALGWLIHQEAARIRETVWPRSFTAPRQTMSDIKKLGR